MDGNNGGIGGKKLVSTAIHNPYLIIVVCLVVIILGVLALFNLPKDLLPSANLPAVQVISFYPGMPVKNVEQTLTARFERFTGQSIGLKRQESKSLVGVSIVKNFFTSNTDPNFAISQTTSLVMSVMGELPPGTLPPYILPFDPMAAVPLALVVVGQQDKPIEHIYDTARYEVRTAIQAVPGAIAPTVMGGTLRTITIYLDPDKLRYYNFSPLNVLNRMSRLSSLIPSGDVKINNLDYQIESNALVENVSDMDDFPLRAEFGVPVYLKDVGHAKDSGLIQTNVVLIDGKEQVYVPIYRQPGGNSIQVVVQVKQAIKKLEKILQATNPTTLTLVADQSFFIRHAINSIIEEALLGGGLAAVMIFLFLGNPRATFGILLSLPLALLAAFIGLQASHQSINAMTLGGLALSIGVLVDNSIVVLENISKKLEAGTDSVQSALEGASEVAMPVLSATLATLVVLFPIVFLTGIVKILFTALAIAVMFAMVGSYIAAMTVMPLFASRFLKNVPSNQLSRFFAGTHNLIRKLTEIYGKMLSVALSYRKTVLTAAVGIFALGAVLVPMIGTELFPHADAGSFTLNVRLPSGTRIELTKAFAQDFDKKLRQWIDPHDLHMIIANAGIGYGFPAAFTPNIGPQDVFFDIELTSDRYHSSQYYAKIIREHIAKEFPEVELGVELGGLLSSALNMGLKAPIDIQISGPNLKQSYQLATNLSEKIKNISGAVDVRVQQRLDDPLIYINIDRQKAMRLGIFTDEIVKNVDSAVSGSETFNTKSYWIDPRNGINYFLAVQLPQAKVASFEQLGNIPVRGFNRNRVLPLNQIATISKTTGWTQINHVDLRPVTDIYLDAQGRDIGGLSEDVEKVIKHSIIPDNYFVKIRGEIAEMQDSIKYLAGGFILAAVLVYLILVVQFRSFILPLVIMVSVPLGLVGIVLMLFVTHTYFSIQAAIGAIFMIGIAVANGVLLIEFITHHVKLNGNIDEGIVAGAKTRLRPILMTSLAAILGLVPMAIGIGHGSEANVPLGRAVVGGQFFSMLLTLFVVPVLYRTVIKTKE